MKKFIVLTLVLSVAPLASAALSIGVEGDPNPVDSEITIAPSDTLLLNLHSDGEVFGVYFMLFVDNAAGKITAPPPLVHCPLRSNLSTILFLSPSTKH